jgi:hypothetical protein
MRQVTLGDVLRRVARVRDMLGARCTGSAIMGICAAVASGADGIAVLRIG